MMTVKLKRKEGYLLAKVLHMSYKRETLMNLESIIMKVSKMGRALQDQ